MGWVKLDDGFFRHPKALAAGSDARLLAIVALCWSGQYMTDGRVPGNALPALAFDAGLSVDDAAAAADRLVEVRMWARDPDGWLIHGWDDWQRSREEREAKAQANADRQRKWRERKAAERAEAESRRDSHVSNALRNGLEAEAEAEAEADTSTSPLPSSVVVTQGGPGDDDDDRRIKAITDRIGKRQADRTPVKSNRRGLTRACKANAHAELGDDVARLLAEGLTPDAVIEQLDPDPNAPKPPPAPVERCAHCEMPVNAGHLRDCPEVAHAP
jgi:uncharacterized protein YdaU (DUF1376 family)